MNAGRPDTTNPCLLTQLAVAAGTESGTPVPVYVNTANPGPAASWWWPTSNAYRRMNVTNPYGICDGTSTAACAYTYGYAMAFDDTNLRGVPGPAHHLWWLDVETRNSWSPDTTANTADPEGMTAYLERIGRKSGSTPRATSSEKLSAASVPSATWTGLGIGSPALRRQRRPTARPNRSHPAGLSR